MNQPLYNAAIKLSKDLNLNKKDFLKIVESKVLPTIPSKQDTCHSQNVHLKNLSETEEDEDDDDKSWSFELKQKIEEAMERLKLARSLNEVAQYLDLIYKLEIEYAEQINQRVYSNQKEANELSKLAYMHVHS